MGMLLIAAVLNTLIVVNLPVAAQSVLRGSRIPNRRFARKARGPARPLRTAQQVISIGETYDFEFTPEKGLNLRL